MPRRVGLPGAAELFRQTTAVEAPAAAELVRQPPPVEPPVPPGRTPPASGRVRHDEKITVYVSSEELLALERLRLELRASHGLAVDRGRIVRAAIAEALADVARNGAGSALLKRLAEQ